MFFVECVKCDVTASGFHAKEEGWTPVKADGHRHTDWYCPEHNEEGNKALQALQEVVVSGPKPLVEAWTPPKAKKDDHFTVSAALHEHIRAKHPLQEEFGFDRPEDGSEKRYHHRKTVVPWLRHQTWWAIHNAVAHPLIAFFPKRWAFQFHDWTSHKMHKAK